MKTKKHAHSYTRTEPITKFYEGQVATVLPAGARSQLVAIGNIDRKKGIAESDERIKALDQAIRQIKRQHPEKFR